MSFLEFQTCEIVSAIRAELVSVPGSVTSSSNIFSILENSTIEGSGYFVTCTIATVIAARLAITVAQAVKIGNVLSSFSISFGT